MVLNVSHNCIDDLSCLRGNKSKLRLLDVSENNLKSLKGL